ncbi:MAG: DNA-processing protein DprA [Acidimicrobiia bacterium]
MTEPSREVAAATLACLPKMTPGRLRALVDHFGSVRQALVAVREGRAADAELSAERGTPMMSSRIALARDWRSSVDADGMALRLARRGTFVWVDGAPDYPIDDPVPDRPSVLLAEGARPDALAARRVAIVGTRAASPHGLTDARELGAYLGAVGITVVSGMAIGIDAAAHEGALAAGGLTVGVVATGVDIEYPRRHRSLYERVRAAGIVVGEAAFGARPERWRFPVRNRIIAALAEVVVVVEATLKGGARITAQYGLEYGRTVLAVPGSRRNPAAHGTNELIADGAQPLLEWSDLLVALGLSDGSAPALRAPARPTPGSDGAALLRALGGDAATPDQLASRAALTPERVAVALFELERTGWIDRAQGAIWPR